MKIFLIGMPASGKSTMGKRLAKEYNLPFIDLDEEIVNDEGRAIPEIFEVEGEGYFREVESYLLKELARRSEYILSTGGGTPCFHDNLEFMLGTGIVFFIDTDKKRITERLIKQKGRPLIDNSSDLKKEVEILYEKRLGFYQHAHYRIERYDQLTTLLEELQKKRGL